MATIQGSASSEPLLGTINNDTIYGAGGSDTIDGLAGTDTVVISSGRVFFTITNLSGAVRVTENGLAAFPYKYTTVRLLNVEKVQFSDSTETILSTTNKVMLSGYSYFSDVFVGTGDNETIDGAGGSDWIDGGAGTDTAVFFGNRSDFKIVNLEGAVRITGLDTAPVDYRYYTTKLINTERVQFADDLAPTNLNLTTNKVMLSGYNFFSNQFVGTADNEIIDGAGGSDWIDGDAGTDTAVFFGNRSDFKIVNLEGAVRITGLSTAPLEYRGYTARLTNTERVQFADDSTPTNLNLTTNKVVLSGYNYFSDVFVGTADNETIDGAGGNDLIDGGAGTDTAVFFGNRSDFKIVNLEGAVRITGLNTAPSDYNGYTTKLINTERVQFADDLAPTNLNLTANKVMLSGYNFFSSLFVGTADNETIDGAGGNDLIDGGAGTDTAVFFGNSSDFSVTNLSGVVQVTGLNTAPSEYRGYTAQLTNVENVQFIDSVDTSTIINLDFFIDAASSSEIRVTQGSYLVEGDSPDDSHLNDAGLDSSGIDLSLSAGTNVYSFSSGKVVGAFSGYNDTLFPSAPTKGSATFGNYVTVEYFFNEIGYPIYVTYAHLTQSTANFWVNAIIAAGGSVNISNKEKVGEVAGDAETPYPVHLHLSFATSYGNYAFPNGIAIASAGSENAFLLSKLSIDGQSLSLIKENDYISGTPVNTANIITGTVNNDNLIGTVATDQIYGLAGNDTLNGASGADTLIGGLNNDTYVVDNVGDVVTEILNEGFDIVRTNLSAYTLRANVENLTLTSTLAANGTGNGLANIITGNALINILNGAAGNDRLLGKGGKDTLTGGAGADKFVFDTVAGTNNIDTITDFVTNTDKILLDDDIFTALGITGTAAGVALTAGKFHAGASALDTLDRIVYNSTTGALYYDANGSASGQNVQIALIGTTTHPVLSAADFQVIA